MAKKGFLASVVGANKKSRSTTNSVIRSIYKPSKTGSGSGRASKRLYKSITKKPKLF